MFARRIVGLQLGSIVYDGPPENLNPDVLTQIYGEEDWEATIEKVKEEDEELDTAALLNIAKVHPPS
jgi:phosphonate transport system ATP-binding protein